MTSPKLCAPRSVVHSSVFGDRKSFQRRVSIVKSWSVGSWSARRGHLIIMLHAHSRNHGCLGILVITPAGCMLRGLRAGLQPDPALEPYTPTPMVCWGTLGRLPNPNLLRWPRDAGQHLHCIAKLQCRSAGSAVPAVSCPALPQEAAPPVRKPEPRAVFTLASLVLTDHREMYSTCWLASSPHRRPRYNSSQCQGAPTMPRRLQHQHIARASGVDWMTCAWSCAPRTRGTSSSRGSSRERCKWTVGW